MASGFVKVYGGEFVAANGSPYAGGYLYCKPNYETAAAGQISAQEVSLGVLDANGNLPLSANVSIWANDSETPSGTAYYFRVTDKSGAPVWGPQLFVITGSSPLNLSTFMPTSASVSYPAPIIQSPSQDQTISAYNLLPAASNTTQSLGSSTAPWDATLYNNTVNNNETVAGSLTVTGLTTCTGNVVTGIITGNTALALAAASSVSVTTASQSSPVGSGNISITTGNAGPGGGNSGNIIFNTGTAASGTIGVLQTNTIVGTYNNISTVANGVPSQIAKVDLTGKTAAISAQSLIASLPSSGLYRVIYVAKVTHIGTSSSTLGGTNGFQVIYTDADDSTASVTSPAGVQTSTGNALTTQVSGTVIINALTATAVTFNFDYTSNITNTMIYAIHVRLEML